MTRPQTPDNRLIVALDVPNALAGLDLVQKIGPSVGFYKIGLGMLTGGGLALANSLAVTAEVLVLMALLRRRWHGVEGRQILRTLIRVGLASLVMGAAVAAVLVYAQEAGLSTFFVLLAGGLVGVVTYIIAGLLFGVREIRRLPAALFGR